MCKQTYFIFLISMCYFNANGLEISVQEERHCQPIDAWDTSQTTFYNTAYNWTHGSNLKHWKFACDSHHASASGSISNALLSNVQCCDMSYKTQIHIPAFIQKLLFSEVADSQLKKRVCFSKKNMREKVQISAVPIMDTVDINIDAQTLSVHRVRFTMRSKLDLPWYIYPLTPAITQHIKKSFRRYIHILTSNVCNK